MASVSGIRLAAQASGIATLSDARTVLAKASELLHTAYTVLQNAQTADELTSVGIEEDTGIAALKYSGLLSLLDQANAYSQKIYAEVNIGDGPIDEHTQQQVVASLQISNEAFGDVQAEFPGRPELNIDFTGTTMETIKLLGDKLAESLKALAKAAGAGAGQALVSFWYIVIPAVVVFGAYVYFRYFRKGRS